MSQNPINPFPHQPLFRVSIIFSILNNMVEVISAGVEGGGAEGLTEEAEEEAEGV